MEEECWKQDKVLIKLDKQTLVRRLQGRKSQAQSNAKHSWVTDAEADALIEYALSLADEGWPFSHDRMEEHANEIIRACHGDDFEGVGGNWTDRFVDKHRTRLQQCWSHPLDEKHAWAGNPTAKKDFFEKLDTTIKGEPDQEPMSRRTCMVATRRVSRKGLASQNGTSTAPAVIFKGENYQTSWKQDNPLNASLGHQKKGYTDGEIGVEWIKNFEKQTCAKANGQQWLLLVDGHNSHYTRGFLEHARQHRIRILCYPSHSTHLYQGLDVVIFSILKKKWSKLRDEYEHKHGHKVTKSTFLGVYAKAHIEALSRENILAAFRKTGVVPFNPDIIPEAAMAPSHTTSTKATLPVPPPSPVRVMGDMIHRYLARQVDTLEDANAEAGPSNLQSTAYNPLLATPTRVAAQELASTSASHLVSNTPPRSTSAFPVFKPYTISPFKHRHSDLLDLEPVTERERSLLQALKEAGERDERQKHGMVGMQATTMLQGLYVKKTRAYLEEHEEQGRKKKKKNRKFGDGLAKLLDADDFFNNAVEIEEAAEKAEADKEERQKRRENHSEALAEWKRLDKERVDQNNKIQREYQEDTQAWRREADEAKSERQKPKWPRPVRKDYPPIEKAAPKPQKPAESDSEEEDKQEEGGGNNSGMDDN